MTTQNFNTPTFPSGDELIERERKSLVRRGFPVPAERGVLAEDRSEYKHTIAGALAKLAVNIEEGEN